MKKLFTVIAVALVSVSAFAQFRVQGGLSLGGYKENDNFNTAPAVAARALYEYGLGTIADGETYFLSAGVGLMMNNNTLKSSTDTKIKMTWIQVPVMLGSTYGIGSGELYASVGLYYAYAISGKSVSSTTTLDLIGDDLTKLFKPHDFGWLVQAGYTFPINLGFYAGFNEGFLDITAVEGTSARNKVFEVGLMYNF